MRVDYSKYRLDTAKECLIESKAAFDNGHFKLSLSRSYYAIFNSLRAVTVLDNFDSKKHKGIISHFNHYYVKTKIFPSDTSDLIEDAFDIRGQADYEDFYLASKRDAQNQIDNAEK